MLTEKCHPMKKRTIFYEIIHHASSVKINIDKLPYQRHYVVCGNATKQMFNKQFLKNTNKTCMFTDGCLVRTL